MEHPYKICRINPISEQIDKIWVFLGKDRPAPAANDRASANFRKIFSDSEIDRFSKTTEITYTTQEIHPDDSLRTIKKKLVFEFGKNTTAYDEIYLFSQIQYALTAHDVFRYRSEPTGTIDAATMQQLAIQLQLPPNTVQPEKSLYDFSDIVDLGLETRPTEIFVPLGMRFADAYDPFFPAYPYSTLDPKSLYDPNPKNPLLLLDESLLLNYMIGNRGSGAETQQEGFKYNVLYVCMAEDILEFAKSRQISESALINMYFPLLAKEDIVSYPSLVETRTRRIQINARILNTSIITLYDKIAMFREIWRGTHGQVEAKAEGAPEYEARGVESFWVTIHPDVKHTIPLDVLFRNIHASKNIPMIKYNPGLRYDNLFRFYYESVSADMTKIPFLTKSEIMKLLERMGSKKQLLSMVLYDKDSANPILADIFPNGNISIRADFANQPILLDEVNTRVIQVYDNIRKIVNQILQESGYSLNRLENIRDRRVEIVDIGYRTSVICKKLDFEKYGGCLSAVFNVLQVDYQRGIEMRYKRVENYTEMDAENAYILDIYKKTNNEQEIIDALKSNLGMTDAEARAKIVQVLSENTQIKGAYVNRAVDFVEHPGFPVRVTVETISKREYRHIFTVQNVNNIQYIHLLDMYIDGFVRINQDINQCGGVKKTVIQKLCKMTKDVQKEKDETHIDRVVANVRLEPDANPEEQIQIHLYDTEPGVADAAVEQEDDDYEDAILFDDYDNDSDSRSGSPTTVISEKSNTNRIVGQNVKEALKSSIEESLKSSSSNINRKSKSSSNKIVIHGDINTNSTNSDNILFDDYDDENDDNHSNKSGGKKSTTSSSSSSTIRDNNIDGLPLNESNNNYFLKRLKTREPTLFVSKPQGKFKSYSRLCPSQFQRQPVILNKREYARLKDYDQENYTQALKYNENYYICPRYWCLKTNSTITQADVDAGKCGKIIPKNADKVPQGAYVYEFNDPGQHHSSIDTKAKITDKDGKKQNVVVVKKGEYFKNNPGFLSADSSPDGKCLPCCFRKLWNSDFLTKQLDQCGIDDDPRQTENKPVGQADNAAAPSAIPATSRKKQTTQNSAVAPMAKRDKYISAIERFPLPEKRFGFLPISIQTFFGFTYKSAISTLNSAELKKDKPTFLRYGTEQSNLFSFVAALCDPYAAIHKLAQIPTVTQMRKVLANAISIDQFANLHNGSLPAIFRPQKHADIDYNNPEYTNSAIYKSVDLKNPQQEDFLHNTIAAYEEFQQFLTKTETAKIDHEYLWDVVAQPNARLFPRGLNLALLEIANNDLTDNVEMVCPSSAYSNYLYDPYKETLVLLKRETDPDANYPIYEPIYLYEDRTGTAAPHITRTFKANTEVKNIERVLTIIKNASKTKCKPLSSSPRQILPFKQNHTVGHLVELLRKKNLPSPIRQIANYQRKIIGLAVPSEGGDVDVFLPTTPSAPVPNIPTVYMDEDSIWRNYRTTTKALLDISRKSKGEIFAKPVAKIIEDGLIVGILTETNQFVKIDPPEENTLYDDGLEVIEGEDTVLADTVLTNRPVRQPTGNRAFITKCIQLETKMYSAFRSFLRILINTVEYKSQRENIVHVLQDNSMTHSAKLDRLIRTLLDIAGERIKFTVFDKEVILKTDEVLVSNTQDTLYLSADHLISKYVSEMNKTQVDAAQIKNKRIYFTRLADELVRYPNVQRFLLSAKNYTNVSNTEYKLNPDEFILLNSILTGTYFDEIEYTRKSPYIHNTVYDNALPQSREQTYSHDVTIQEQKEYLLRQMEAATAHPPATAAMDTDDDRTFALFNECQKDEPGNIEGQKRSKWRVRFEKTHRDAREWKFKNTVNCTYALILYIIYEYKHVIMTTQELKTALVKKYKHYLTKHREAIYHILTKQGKSALLKNVKKGANTFESVVVSESYYLTDLDIWMLAEEYDLPIVLFSTRGIIGMVSNARYREIDWMVLDRNYKKKERFYFVKSDTTKIDIPRSSVIIPCMTFEELGEDMGGWMRDSADMANFDSLTTFFERYEM